MLRIVGDYDADNEMWYGSIFIHFTGVIFNGHDNANFVVNDMWSTAINFELTFKIAFHIRSKSFVCSCIQMLAEW